jgi:hypothetical protein
MKMEEQNTDLLGNPLTYVEQEVLEIHERLKALALRDDLPPCVVANARHALAATWQICNDLDLAADFPDAAC